MRVRPLLPALVSIAVLGVTPLGSALSRAGSAAFYVPQWLCLAACYALIIGAGVAGMMLVSLVLEDHEPTRTDSFLAIDHRNGQGFFAPLLFTTLVLGGFAVASSLGDLASLSCASVAGVIGLAPEWLMSSGRKQPDLQQFLPAIDEKAMEDFRRDSNQVGNGYDRTYAWNFVPVLTFPDARRTYSIRLRIPVAVFDAFKGRPHPTPNSNSELADLLPRVVLDGMCGEVAQCAFKIAREARMANLPYLDFVDFVLAFVRDSIDYAADEVLNRQRKYVAYPVETLVHKKGDCDDHAILGAAVLITLGIDTILIIAPEHLAVGVAVQMDREGRWVTHGGRKYYYGEATPAGDWRLGEIPTKYDVRDLTPVSLNSR